MRQTSEYCAVGHPDRMCDFVASWLLDRWLEKDPCARVALEVQLKGHDCTVSGEVTSSWRFTGAELSGHVRDAIREVGYVDEYRREFGEENTICADDVEVTFHLSQQSLDIAQGVDADGWGDQGIFWGMAVDSPETGNMPLDHYLARKVTNTLYRNGYGGIDIKTLVTVEDGKPVECVVAIPIAPGHEETGVRCVENLVKSVCGGGCRVTVNGTGRYVTHGPVGDCGTTGRKLVADFYGGNCRIGGGSPWGKDATKADVALNILARMKALEYMRGYGLPCVYCAISCCIGRREIAVSYYDAHGAELATRVESAPPSHVIERLGLKSPGYAERCRDGLFGFEGGNARR